MTYFLRGMAVLRRSLATSCFSAPHDDAAPTLSSDQPQQFLPGASRDRPRTACSTRAHGSARWAPTPHGRRSPHRARHLPTEAAATGLFNKHFPAGPRRRDLKQRHRLVRRSAGEMLLVKWCSLSVNRSLTLSPQNGRQRALLGRKIRHNRPHDGSRHFRRVFPLSEAITQTPAKQGHFQRSLRRPPDGRTVNQRRLKVRGP